jgi:hypothetical protein
MNMQAEALVNRLLESEMTYDQLPENAKQAVYQYMVTDGGVEPEDYEAWVRNFVYRSETVSPEKLKAAWRAWGWTGQAQHPSDAARIRRIQRLRRAGKGTWPYIVGGGATFEEWASDDMNHGDGYHRVLASVNKGEPVEFLFLRNTKRGLTYWK